VLKVAEVFSCHAVIVVAQERDYPTGGFMEREKLVHDLIVDRLRGKFSKEYGEIKVNPEGSPDIISPATASPWRWWRWRQRKHYPGKGGEVEGDGPVRFEADPHGSKECKSEDHRAFVETRNCGQGRCGSYEIVITMP